MHPSHARARLAIGLASLLVGAVACNPSDVLKVRQPDNIGPGGLNDSSALPALKTGTLSAFQVAYSGGADLNNGGHEGHINMTGIFSDEMQDQETFPTRIQVDARLATTGNQNLNSLFIDISTARAFAEKALRQYAKFAPNDPAHALMHNMAGYSYLILAEDYCNGVPQSTLNDNGSFAYGTPLTTAQMLSIAGAHFDSAVTIATAAADTLNLNLAQVGKGRALLDGNDDAGAAAAVASVPLSFHYLIGASTNSGVENNGIWFYTAATLEFGVSDHKGTNGLPFVSAMDPRVPFLDTGAPGTAGAEDFILQLLYPAVTTSIPLSTGIEAQLILAEHQQRTGGPWLATLNALRTTVPGLAPLVDPVAPAARVDMLMSERAFWLYLTDHRISDMRRLVRQYGRDQSTVFPVGVSVNGQPYGTDVNFPVPSQEAANPNFHGCIDRNA
jgi:starch-binding outer membrane protein, SusD/RagB family